MAEKIYYEVIEAMWEMYAARTRRILGSQRSGNVMTPIRLDPPGQEEIDILVRLYEAESPIDHGPSLTLPMPKQEDE